MNRRSSWMSKLALAGLSDCAATTERGLPREVENPLRRMTIHARNLLLSLCCAFPLAGCPGTNSRRVDAPRPAIGCRNYTTSISLEARILQDVAGGGCLLLWLREGSGGPFDAVDQDFRGDVGIGLFRIARWAARCSEVPAGNYDVVGAQPTSAGGWLTLERSASSVVLNASIDVVFGNDPELPVAQLRIENMDLNNREGWVECVVGL